MVWVIWCYCICILFFSPQHFLHKVKLSICWSPIFFVDAKIQMGFQLKTPAPAPGPKKTKKNSWNVPRSFFSEALQFNRCATTMAIRVEAPPSATVIITLEGLNSHHQWKVAEFNICTAGWWFQICFIFIPTWGNDPIWLIFFQMGWNHQLDVVFCWGNKGYCLVFGVCVWDVGMFDFCQRLIGKRSRTCI